jgi:shikimate kinase
MSTLRNIFLTGLPGSGKSSTGKELANALKCPFIDSDEYIEWTEGMSVSEIFRTYGESYFRQKEADFLQNLDVSLKIVSTGGGMPCFYNNLDVMKKKGHVVYLKCDPETIAGRMSEKEIRKRPLWKHSDVIAVQNYLEDILRDRSAFYEEADVIADGQQSTEIIVKNIMICLRQP